MPKRKKINLANGFPVDDQPQVGDIWQLVTPYGDEYKTFTYLLLEKSSDEFFRASDGTFEMLQLENGENIRLYMNFDLDDWRKLS